MSKVKFINPYADETSMMIQSGLILATGAYYTVKSTTSIMDDQSEHVLKYRS